jgi:transposase
MTISELLPFNLPGFEIDALETEDESLTIVAHRISASACCPDCQAVSASVHSYYARHPQDLPCIGRAVRWQLVVQRFRCQNPNCPRKTFVERLPEQLPLYGRRLERLTSLLRSMGLDVGGEAAARIGQLLQITVSGDTVLRIVRQTKPSPSEPARVLGVDDWAFAKGRRYGTILVDLECHQPIDLLPNREAKTLATWLQAHPGIEIIARDRSSEYAAGIAEGAPAAVQVADRWHLLKNLGDMVQRVVESHRAALRKAAYQVLAPAGVSLASPELKSELFHDTLAADQIPSNDRQMLFQEVKRLMATGYGDRDIARQLPIDPRTVARYRTLDVVPVRGPVPLTISKATPYLVYLQQRLAEGGSSRTELWQEIKEQGFTGSYKMVCRVIGKLNPKGPRAASTSPAPPPLSPRKAAWLLTQSPDKLDDEQTLVRNTLCDCCEDIAAIYPLVQRFVQMVAERDVDGLDLWLTDAHKSPVSKLRSFSKSLQQDYQCVRAALAYEWSNGQTEGQVNRLKLIKRQMYGRAGFDLLRIRVLHPT